MQEDKFSTYKGVRIDDTTDWHLTIYISDSGMSAYLKNLENPLEPFTLLFNEEWKVSEHDLLSNIENAVYEHPQLFEDFSTDVVLSASKCLWIPKEVEENSEGLADMYRQIYSANPEDLFYDSVGNMTCVYSFAPGLPSFMRRTLSGARIRSQQGVLVKRFSESVADMPRMYVNIREREADIVLFDGKKLLLSVTYGWQEYMDLSYHVLNVADVYGMDRKNLQVSISGMRDVKTELMRELRRHITYVMLTMLPSGFSKLDVPLGVALVMSRVSRTK